MRLASLSEFRALIYTPGSAPALKTLRRSIGEIPGGRIESRGGRGFYYVDLDEYSRHTGLRNRLEAERAELAKDPLLDGLL